MISWGSADYPCQPRNKTAGVDCEPHCLYEVHSDESERRELSGSAKAEDKAALARLLGIYAAIGKEKGMPNLVDVRFNEQGTPYDPEACKAASAGGGYWRPWIKE